MHEYGIASEVVAAVDRTVCGRGGRRAARVVVTAGADVVDEESLRTAFDVVKRHTVAHDAQLVVEPQSIDVGCLGCGRHTPVARLAEFTCPGCGGTAGKAVTSPSVWVTSIEIEV